MEVDTRSTHNHPLPLIVLVNYFLPFFAIICLTFYRSLDKYLFSRFPQVMSAREMLSCSGRRFMKSN